MNQSKVTPKDFFLWAGAVIALYVGVVNYIALVWDYVDYAMPDPLQYYSSDPYQSGISWEMASLIVLTPAFLALMFLIRRDIAKDSSRLDTWVRRWALYLTVFLAGAMIVGDLIYVLYTFLNGWEITASFLLKSLVVLFVAGTGLMHFLADIWNYWQKFPVRNQYVAGGTLALVIFTVVAGFFIVGTPAQARLHRLDEQRINDLVSIQYQIVNYWQQKEKLPITLADLNDPLSGFVMPRDPQSGDAYRYEKVTSTTFKLCAVFNADGQLNTGEMVRAIQGPVPAGPMGTGEKGVGLEDSTWSHGSGEVCFLRTIDPERYPPYSKTKSI